MTDVELDERVTALEENIGGNNQNGEYPLNNFMISCSKEKRVAW